MGFIGVQPASVPITSSDIDDGTIQPADLNLAGNYAFTGTVTGAGQSLRPNSLPLLINSNMAVAQRGTSFTHANSNNDNFPVDRFSFVTGSIGAFTSTQESLTSGAAYNAGFRKAARIDCTTADSSPASGDYFWFQYVMEAQDCLVFKKGTSSAEKMTVAFWVKSNKTGTGQLTVKDSDNDRQVAGTYTISSANTWEHKVINLPADTTGAINNDNGAGFRFEWWLGAGSSYSSGAVPTSWEARSDGDRGVSTLAINDNTANDWAITGIQVEVGEFTSSTLPAFQHESFGNNLKRCERYFQVIAKKESGDNEDAVLPFAQYSGSTIYGVYNFRTEMRTAPSLSCASGSNYFRWFRQNSNTEFNTFTLDKSSPQNCDLYQSVSGTQGSAGWVRMINNAPDGSLVALTGEL